jgi:hypothetical protein
MLFALFHNCLQNGDSVLGMAGLSCSWRFLSGIMFGRWSLREPTHSTFPSLGHCLLFPKELYRNVPWISSLGP